MFACALINEPSVSPRTPKSTDPRIAGAPGNENKCTQGQRAGSQKIECHFEAVRRILDPSHNKWSNIAAKISDRIDQRYAACGGRSAQENRGKWPKRGSRAIDSDHSETYCWQRPEGVSGHARERESDSGGDRSCDQVSF